MKFDVISLFPDYFDSPLNTSILKRAVVNGLISFNFVDLRKFGLGRFLKVDDTPFGGGAGMVLSAEPLVSAIRSLAPGHDTRVVCLSPQGHLLNAAKCRELAGYKRLILVCGHYEGIDQRVIDLEVDEEVSIGDYVLTSGSAPALILIDAVSRFIPGVLGNHEGVKTESFENGLLEYPQYTRPGSFEGISVPDVLLKGNHKDINFWRLNASIDKTKKNRPDLYLKYLCGRESEDKHEEFENVGFSFEVVVPVRNVIESLRFYSKVFGLGSKNLEKEVGLEIEALVPLARGQGLRLKLDNGVIENMVFSAGFEEIDVFEKSMNRWKNFAKPMEIMNDSDQVRSARFQDPSGHNWVLFLKKDK